MGGRPGSIWPSGVEAAAGKTAATRPRNTRVGPQRRRRQSRGERSSGGPAGSTAILPFHPPAPSLQLSRVFAVAVDVRASQRFYFWGLLLLHPSFCRWSIIFVTVKTLWRLSSQKSRKAQFKIRFWVFSFFHYSLILEVCFLNVHHCCWFTVSFEITFT